jgi:ferredoxin-type protein NapH
MARADAAPAPGRTRAPASRQGWRRITRWRRACQASFALLFLLLPLAGTTAVAGTLVALKLGDVDLVEPASALSAVLASRAAPWALVAGTLPLIGLAVLLGPVYCSWACPFGLASELLDPALGRRRRPWTGGTTRTARLTALTALLGASVVLGLPLAALLAPPRLLTALPIELRAPGALPVVTVTLLAAALVLEVAGPRRFLCRALCPAGALAALLRRRSTLAPRCEARLCRCAEPAACLRACPWGLDPRTMRTLDGCTTCLACLDACPTGALTAGFSR